MPTDAEKRRRRREIRLLQSESTWLQKALFDLRKAESAHADVAVLRDEDETESMRLSLDGREVEIEALEDAIEDRAQRLLDTVRQMRRELR